MLSVAAFSFGFWRYTTEVEAYIIPIFFSISGTYYYLTYQKSSEKNLIYIVFSGLVGVIACLYHQIHIFWWAGILIGFISFERANKIRNGILYTLPFLIVIIAYLCVIKFYTLSALNFQNIQHFILHDLDEGLIDTHIGFRHFLLGSINLFRTFYQLHGSVFFLFTNNILLGFAGICSISLMVALLYLIYVKRKDIAIRDKFNFKIYLFIFLLQLGFAVFNAGNAEFMVMLPVLLALILVTLEGLNIKILWAFILSLFIWNLSLAIIPQRFFKYANDEKIAGAVIIHKNQYYVLEDRGIALNICYYKLGNSPMNIISSPAFYQRKYGNSDSVKCIIANAIKSNAKIFTDCTGRPFMINRASMQDKELNKQFFKNYHLLKADSFYTYAGLHYLYEVKK